ncbi:MAG: hypothetical protein ACAI44_34515 [Candidatus Sericytochromatia bacterium]
MKQILSLISLTLLTACQGPAVSPFPPGPAPTQSSSPASDPQPSTSPGQSSSSGPPSSTFARPEVLLRTDFDPNLLFSPTRTAAHAEDEANLIFYLKTRYYLDFKRNSSIEYRYLHVLGQSYYEERFRMLIQVFSYASAEALAADAGQINLAGTMANNTRLENADQKPHFFKSGRILVLYYATKDSKGNHDPLASKWILGFLIEILGAQFAGPCTDLPEPDYTSCTQAQQASLKLRRIDQLFIGDP